MQLNNPRVLSLLGGKDVAIRERDETPRGAGGMTITHDPNAGERKYGFAGKTTRRRTRLHEAVHQELRGAAALPSNVSRAGGHPESEGAIDIGYSASMVYGSSTPFVADSDVTIAHDVGTDPEPLAFAAAEALAENLREPIDTIQRLLRLTDRTWARRRDEGAFNADESDALYRIARVARMAIDVLGDEDKARGWLEDRNYTLSGRRPLDLLGSDQGAALVVDELNRIEYGDLF